MRMKALGKFISYLIAALVLTSIIVAIYFFLNPRLGVILLYAPIDLGDEYKYDYSPSSNTRIRKNDEVVVHPMIIDFDTFSDYVVGIRLPRQNFTCNNDTYATYMIMNNKNYFILSKPTGEVLSFESKTGFEEELNRLEIADEISLDYNKFSEARQYYAKSMEVENYSNCTPIETDVK